MASRLIAVATMFLNRVIIWNGGHCLRFRLVGLIGRRAFLFPTMILTFGGKILDKTFLSFEHYSRSFKFVVPFHKAEYCIRKSFPKVTLQCFHFGKRFVKVRFSLLFNPSKEQFFTNSSLKILLTRKMYVICFLYVI